MNTPKLILPIMKRKLRHRYYEETSTDDPTHLLKAALPWWKWMLLKLKRKIK